VFGRGGSRRAGEQAAARLALEVAEQAAQKNPGGARKSRPRSAQLKLAGIATDQSAEQNAGPNAEAAVQAKTESTRKPAA
jgi:ribonuclease-3